MTNLTALLGLVMAAGGVAAAWFAVTHRRVAGAEAAEWLTADLAGAGAVVGGAGAASMPFADRVMWPALGRLGDLLVASTPRARLDRLHGKLLHAGLSARVRAEEFLALNVLTALGAILLSVAWVSLAAPPGRTAVMGVGLLVIAGVAAPRAWLERHVGARKEAIFKDLPDALDLMVISMEAGTSFDGSIQVVAEHLDGALAEELVRTLTEMELGLARRDALQNLKRRVDVPELSNVLVALLQADALGMPVSRVLRVQATEMRAKRRQWAREKAGKLPVKILFPLIAFIFPPVMVLIVGPVVGDLAGMFG